MNARSEPLSDEAQPENPGMGGLRHRSLHVELKDRFRSASALLRQPPPVGVAPARSAIASQAIAHGL